MEAVLRNSKNSRSARNAREIYGREAAGNFSGNMGVGSGSAELIIRKKLSMEFIGEQENNLLLAREIVPYLLDWFAGNARILPWREQPKPYYVWISEIMLQQTRVEAVKGYFERFIAALPDIEALAEVSEDRLLKLWEGLGYYSRARNLKKAALLVMQEYQGKLPDQKEELLKLPGIGAYTAGAIASIAYGRAAAAVDGNVVRVMLRLRGSLEVADEAVKKELAETIEEAMPKDKPGAFNQALMELGAMVCLPNGKPLCEKCPVMHLCKAFQKGIQLAIPVKPAKKPRRIEEKTVLVMETKDGILVRKRPDKGLLAGLWEYPCLEGKHSYEEVEELLAAAGFRIQKLSRMQDAKHIFSHIEWHMAGYYVSGEMEASATVREKVQYGEEKKVSGTARKKKQRVERKDISGAAKEKSRYEEREEISGAAQEKAQHGKKGIDGCCIESAILDGCFPVGRKQLREEYSIPSAFDAYRIEKYDLDQKEDFYREEQNEK